MRTEAETLRTVTALLERLLPADLIDADTDIFATGMVNSLISLQIINLLEQTFELEVGEDDLEIENFSSIRNMARFVLSKDARA
jgi:acyl carrier protein